MCGICRASYLAYEEQTPSWNEKNKDAVRDEMVVEVAVLFVGTWMTERAITELVLKSRHVERADLMAGAGQI